MGRAWRFIDLVGGSLSLVLVAVDRGKLLRGMALPADDVSRGRALGGGVWLWKNKDKTICGTVEMTERLLQLKVNLTAVQAIEPPF